MYLVYSCMLQVFYYIRKTFKKIVNCKIKCSRNDKQDLGSGKKI